MLELNINRCAMSLIALFSTFLMCFSILIQAQDPPIANDDYALGPYNLDIIAGEICDNDSGEITSTEVTIEPNYGVVILSDDNCSFTYYPTDDFNGEDSFEYTICGPGGCDSAIVTMEETPQPLMLDLISECVNGYPVFTIVIMNGTPPYTGTGSYILSNEYFTEEDNGMFSFQFEGVNAEVYTLTITDSTGLSSNPIQFTNECYECFPWAEDLIVETLYECVNEQPVFTVAVMGGTPPYSALGDVNFSGDDFTIADNGLYYIQFSGIVYDVYNVIIVDSEGLEVYVELTAECYDCFGICPIPNINLTLTESPTFLFPSNFNLSPTESPVVQLAFHPDDIQGISIGEDEDNSATVSNATFEQTKLLIYPNPAQNEITIDSKGQELGHIQIISSNGAIVKSILQSDNTNKQKMDISDLASGYYLIRLQTKDQVLTEKLMVH